MPQPPTSSAPRDWLLLASGSTYKFTLTGFYLVALVAILKNHGYSLNQLSWIHLIGGIEAAKVLFAALMERRSAGRFGRFLFGSNLKQAGCGWFCCLPLPNRMRLWRQLLCPGWRIWASTRSRRAGFWRWAFLLPA